MAYEATARQSAWRFLCKTADPRLSMLRRSCKAMGIDLPELLKSSMRTSELEPAERFQSRPCSLNLPFVEQPRLPVIPTSQYRNGCW